MRSLSLQSRSAGLLLLSVMSAAVMLVGLWFSYHNWQFVLWLVSLAFLLAAFWNGQRQQAERIASSGETWTTTEAAVLVIIVGVGAFFRLYRLDVLPPGLWVDESNVVGHAVSLMNDKPFQPFGWSPLTWREQWVQTSNIYLYSIVLIFKVFGYNYWAIKMISVIPGILGVPVLYLFCRELAGRQTAAVAGLFYAVGHWNVRLSRWGWDEVAMTTLQILSYYFLVRGLRRKQRRSLVWAGMAMGLCLCTYVASRLALAAALLCLGGYVLSRWGGWSSRLKPLLIFSVAVFLTVAPFSIFYIQHPNLFNVRTGELNILQKAQQLESLEPLWTNVRAHLLMFHVRGDPLAKHDLPYAPLLDPVTGVVFPIGLAMTLWKWRSPGYLLCQCWLWMGLLGGMLSETGGNPHAYRTGNVAPVAMVMAALALALVFRQLQRPGKRRVARGAVAAALAGGVMGTVTWLNYENYFVQYARLKSLWDDVLLARGTNVARYILRHAHDRPVYISRWVLDAGFGTLLRSDLNPKPPIRNWNPNYWDADTNAPLGEVTDDVTYFCAPSWRLWIEGWYPHAHWRELQNMYGDVYCAVAEIPAEDIAATQGLYRYVLDGSRPTPEVESRALKTIGRLDGTWTVFEGVFFQGLGEFVTLGVPHRNDVKLWVNERPILKPRQQVSEEIPLSPGLHSLWLLVPGAHEHPPQLMVRHRGLRGSQVPVENFSPSSSGVRHGLRGTFYSGVDWQGPVAQVVEASEPIVTQTHPPPPYSVVWSGYLHIDQGGDYVLGVAADDGASMTLDGRPVLSGRNGYVEKSVPLSAGEHPLKITYFETGTGGSYLSVRWILPQDREVVGDGQWTQHGFAPVRADFFYRLPFAGRGLRARYYDNTQFEGEPFLSLVEAGNWLGHHNGEHYSLELEGDLYFPTSGVYTLALNSDDGSWLYLDGKLLVDNGGTHSFGPVSKKVEVSTGAHHILVRYFQDTGGSGLQLLWGYGEEELSPIPPVFLYPQG